MHKTIANKLYDTSTAKAMGNWQKGYTSDRGYLSETLYLKKTGEYFLHGEGGPRSRYAQRVAPNTWGYGERIIPLTHEEAHAWAENHLTETAYEVVFGAIPDDGSLTSITVKLRTSTTEKLHRVAREQGRQISELTDELLARALE
jgi:hypothetical protein